MTDTAIYQCRRGCTIAVPRESENPDEIVLVDSAGDAFPECKGCTETGDRQDILWIGQNDEIRLTRGTCTFCSTEASHRDLVPHPHVCTCEHREPEAIPEKVVEETPQEPEPAPEPTKPGDEQPLKSPWTPDEDGIVRVCTSQDGAVSAYDGAYGMDKRTQYAIKQRWLKHNREGTLIRPGLQCTIRDNGPFYGSHGTVAGITDDKKSVNVATKDGAIYQVAAKHVEVEK